MGISFSTLSGTMVAADVATEWDKAYTWFHGGVVNTDVAAASLGNLHVRRGTVYGWPVNGTQNTTHDIYGESRQDYPHLIWQTERKSIFPLTMGVVQRIPVIGLCHHLHLTAAADIEFEAQWGASERHEEDKTSPSGDYPALAGSFVAVIRDRSDKSETVYEYTRRDLYTSTDRNGGDAWVKAHRLIHNTFSTRLVESLAAGHYDVYVAFEADNAIEHTRQVVIDGNMSWTLEVFKD